MIFCALVSLPPLQYVQRRLPHFCVSSKLDGTCCRVFCVPRWTTLASVNIGMAVCRALGDNHATPKVTGYSLAGVLRVTRICGAHTLVLTLATWSGAQNLAESAEALVVEELVAEKLAARLAAQTSRNKMCLAVYDHQVSHLVPVVVSVTVFYMNCTR